MDLITAIIVDDEPEAREILENLLLELGGITILSRESTATDALGSIIRHKPDLIFLDIDMPYKTGFDLVKDLRAYSLKPAIIFVTAYNQYAIEAIRHAAFDFILKPVVKEELARAIERYRKIEKEEDFQGRINRLLEQMEGNKIRFNTRQGFFYLDAREVFYLQAHRQYTEMHLTDQTVKTLSINLGVLETTLPSNHFARINRSVLVNRRYISEVNRVKKLCYLRYGDYLKELEITTTYMRQLERMK
jgi:two-component system LytT family response regulator